MSVEASRIDCLDGTSLVEFGGASKQRVPARHLEGLQPCAYDRKIRQRTDIETHLPDDTVHLVKHVEEPPIRKVERFPETVEYDADPVSVAALALRDCWTRLARDDTFRKRYDPIRETTGTRGYTTRFWLCCGLVGRKKPLSPASKQGRTM